MQERRGDTAGDPLGISAKPTLEVLCTQDSVKGLPGYWPRSSTKYPKTGAKHPEDLLNAAIYSVNYINFANTPVFIILQRFSKYWNNIAL